MKTRTLLIPILASAALIGASIYAWKLRANAPYEAYDKGDYAAAAQLLTPRAEKGDARAQWVLGMVYYFQEKPDYAAARQWFEQAAANGESNALLYLAEMYTRDDRGVEKNLPLARELLEKGVQQGNANAADTLFLYDYHSGPFYKALIAENNPAAADALRLEAPQWLEQATLLGLDKTNLLLYHIACSGYMERHLAELLPHYEKAAQAGSSRAHYRLGQLALAAGDGDKAQTHFTAALENAKESIDSAMAHYGLAQRYAQGTGVTQDAAQARMHYSKAAGRDCAFQRQAQYQLALMQAQGQGGAQDLDGARDGLQTLTKTPFDAASLARLQQAIEQAENPAAK